MATQKTPRKRQPRHQHNTSQSYNQSSTNFPSDYDSEAFVPPPYRTNPEINHSVLLRYVPTLTSVLSIAPATQIYTFTPETSTWDRAGIEGSLFVCRLAPSPLTGTDQHCIIVLNRRGLDNLIIDMRDIENVEITEEFLLVTMMSQGELKTLGIFMFKSTEQVRSDNSVLIKEGWEQAMREKEQIEIRGAVDGGIGVGAFAGQANGGEGAFGRRLSLTDLFGQR